MRKKRACFWICVHHQKSGNYAPMLKAIFMEQAELSDCVMRSWKLTMASGLQVSGGLTLWMKTLFLQHLILKSQLHTRLRVTPCYVGSNQFRQILIWPSL